MKHLHLQPPETTYHSILKLSSTQSKASQPASTSNSSPHHHILTQPSPLTFPTSIKTSALHSTSPSTKVRKKLNTKTMSRLIVIFYTSLALFSIQSTLASAQSSAPAPTPSGPTNVTKILEKAGQYTVLIRLLKSTRLGDQINTQLNNSNQGITIFAPTDNAFSSLKPGTLNSLTDQQKVQLIQFHVVPTFLSTSQFQTVSNPLRTQAGNSNAGEFPLNVTTSGNQVNISTGIVDTTVANTVYTDSQLAVYQVDKVLLPLGIFAPKSPAPAPEPTKTKKKGTGPGDSPSSGDTADTSDASVGFLPTFKLGFSVAVTLLVPFCM